MTNALFAVLAAAAGLLLLAQGVNLAAMSRGDPLSRAIGHGLGVFVTIGLWALLAGVLALARTRGELPSFSLGAVMSLWAASLLTALATLGLFRAVSGPRWLLVPVSLPPLLLGCFAVALWFPALRPAVQSTRANIALWGSALVASLIPWPWIIMRRRANAAAVEESARLHRRDAERSPPLR